MVGSAPRIMSRKEPNWSAFYRRLQRLGPRMLRGVPEDYQWWVEETSVDTDRFWPGTQDVFYTWWSWSESPSDQRRAVLETLKRWANNVVNEMNYMSDIWEQSPQLLRRLQRRINGIKLEVNDEYVDYMLAGAQLPVGAPIEDEALDSDRDDIPVETLFFELLPPGSSETSDIVSRLKRSLSEDSSKYQGRVVDETRLTKIRTLEPAKCYIGSEKWRGYVLFEFLSRDRVVLECPIEGNATYILTGDWRELVQHSKAYLRRNFSHRCERVFHQGDWLARVRQALSGE